MRPKATPDHIDGTMSRARQIVLAISLAAGMVAYGAQSPDFPVSGKRTAAPGRHCENMAGSRLFARTELYFGLSKPNGEVSEEAFQSFVDTEVTSRFPHGLTVLQAKGQSTDAAGNRIAEASKLLILLYPLQDKSDAALELFQAIEAIRTAYKKAFQQESVLRADEQSCLSF